MPRKPIAMIGRKFGHYLVIGPAGQTSSGEAIYLCRCECGKEKYVRGGHLRSGAIISCGTCSKKK